MGINFAARSKLADTMQDDGVPSGMAAGIAAGTRVATNIGWRPAEGVLPGDQVLTFDEGLQTVVDVTRGVLWPDPERCPEHLLPLHVPAGVLGNDGPMLLMPEQSVMLESDVAESVYGDPFALLPATALDGVLGIERIKPRGVIEVVLLAFETDQIVFADVSALFHCPAAGEGDFLSDLLSTGPRGSYAPISVDMAEVLLTIIEAERDGVSMSIANAPHALA